jgi:hypothetical protein
MVVILKIENKSDKKENNNDSKFGIVFERLKSSFNIQKNPFEEKSSRLVKN